MLLFYLSDNVAKTQSWILNSVTFFAIFLEFVILFNMSQPVCKAEEASKEQIKRKTIIS